jgi:hypothetical protein
MTILQEDCDSCDSLPLLLHLPLGMQNLNLISPSFHPCKLNGSSHGSLGEADCEVNSFLPPHPSETWSQMATETSDTMSQNKSFLLLCLVKRLTITRGKFNVYSVLHFNSEVFSTVLLQLLNGLPLPLPRHMVLLPPLRPSSPTQPAWPSSVLTS